MLLDEHDVLEEIKPILATSEKKLYNSLLIPEDLTTKNPIVLSALKQRLIMRGLSLSILLNSVERPLITYLVKVLEASGVDRDLYMDEVSALISCKTLQLKENEFHYATVGNLKNLTQESSDALFASIS